MCRSGQEGGRRCPNSGRSSQNRRQRRCRANRALRNAIAAGDPDAISRAQQRLDALNADDHDTTTSDKEPTVANDPKPTPVTGEPSNTPLQKNTWGDILSDSPVHYHDDGPIGTAVKYMGADARMEVDGEPLANVVGRLATNVVRRETTAQRAVDDLKQLRDRLPEGSRAKMCLSQAIREMDGPDTPAPQVPDGTPEPLRDLVRKLHAVPLVRREPEREMQPLLQLCERAAAGDKRTMNLLDDEVKRLRNKRHESLGDSGKFEIDDAIDHTIATLKEQERQRRRERNAASAGGVTVHNVNVAHPGAHVGSQHDINTDDVHFNARRPVHDRDVTPEPPTSHTEARPHRGGGQGRSITNIADGGSHVGIQAGVVYGDARVNSRRVSTGSSGQHGRHDGDIANIATGGSHVEMQVGVVFGDGKRVN
ncbi:hypothetical protein [Lentzea nigeriaca]|uniref:hypothetical protein n=1 Tax=Lentzea nigeriaca TaxID=1128665 RepID=UPI00195BC81D|nr:hypothetical protein [Lentzea nigeriaca]MBM7861905.1 hypothetical protein [Lentzea nigeriaca]